MELFFYLINILRPHNCIIAGIGTLLGAWISVANLSIQEILILFFVTFTATGFGNVINDISDVKTDKINHPERPLPSEVISIRIAILYSIILGFISTVGAFYVAPMFGIGTVIPLVLLILYAFILKRTPLIGNLVVSLLVPYSLIFPSIGAPYFLRIVIPCVIAFCLNFSREIVKTLQDEAGDRAIGLTTTAVLPHSLLKKIIVTVNLLCILLMILQSKVEFSGKIYLLLVCVVIFPIHLIIFYFIIRYKLIEKIKTLSLLYKIEMICGIVALAVDNLWFVKK